MLKFLHAADIHLDSPLRGLERYEGAPAEQVSDATRQALSNLVDLAIAEEVGFVLIAGDLYDGDWKDYNTGLFLAREMSRLRSADIQVFIVAGNHDAASQITHRLTLPENVHRLGSRNAESLRLERFDVVIHGRSFATRATTENLALEFPAAQKGCFNIGLLHTSLTGYAGHEPYAPCSLNDLLIKGYNYWALGHVHNRHVVQSEPWVVFPGNTQGRNIRETGPKGCTLVTVDDAGTASVEHRNLNVLRWEMLQLDAEACAAPEDVVDLLRTKLSTILKTCDERPLACRVQVTGHCQAHRELSNEPERWTNELRQAATDDTGGMAWIEKVQITTAMPIDLDELSSRTNPIGDLVRFAQETGENPEQLASLAAVLSDLRSKLPAELCGGDDAIDLGSPEALKELLSSAQQLLIPRLLSQGEEQ